jgi:hypothetical protein
MWMRGTACPAPAVLMPLATADRGVVLWARWATHFNSFIFQADQFPNATAMVESLHADGIRVTFWLTSIINTDSENYQEVRTPEEPKTVRVARCVPSPSARAGMTLHGSMCACVCSLACVCVWLGGCARQALDKGYFLNDGKTVECTSCTTLLITCARAPRNSPVP